MYEMCQGSWSEIFPYLQIIGWSDPGYWWPKETLDISNDHYLTEECEDIAATIDEEWELLHTVFKSFPDFFSP